MNKKSIILGLTLALVGCLPMGASFAAGTPQFKNIFQKGLSHEGSIIMRGPFHFIVCRSL